MFDADFSYDRDVDFDMHTEGREDDLADYNDREADDYADEVDYDLEDQHCDFYWECQNEFDSEGW